MSNRQHIAVSSGTGSVCVALLMRHAVVVGFAQMRSSFWNFSFYWVEFVFVTLAQHCTSSCLRFLVIRLKWCSSMTEEKVVQYLNLSLWQATCHTRRADFNTSKIFKSLFIGCIFIFWPDQAYYNKALISKFILPVLFLKVTTLIYMWGLV